jgi:hypothetical protein
MLTRRGRNGRPPRRPAGTDPRPVRPRPPADRRPHHPAQSDDQRPAPRAAPPGHHAPVARAATAAPLRGAGAPPTPASRPRWSSSCPMASPSTGHACGTRCGSCASAGMWPRILPGRCEWPRASRSSGRSHASPRWPRAPTFRARCGRACACEVRTTYRIRECDCGGRPAVGASAGAAEQGDVLSWTPLRCRILRGAVARPGMLVMTPPHPRRARRPRPRVTVGVSNVEDSVVVAEDSNAWMLIPARCTRRVACSITTST